MNSLLRLAIPLLCLCIASPALATDNTALIYSKTILKILPAAPKPVLKSIDDKAKPDDKPDVILPKLARTAKEFIIEVRPLSFLAQRDFIAHQPFGDKEGMMLVVDPPAVATLRSANLMGKVDVLFVDADGLITTIAPDIALPTLSEPLTTDKPVHAFVFLKGGTTKSGDILPGDKIVNPLFKTHPIVLDENSAGVKAPEK